MTTEPQPVGWGRAVFVSAALLALLLVIEVLAAVPLLEKHISLAAGVISAVVVAGSVALLLPLCFELAFANRLRDPASLGAARPVRWISGIAIFLPVAYVALLAASALTDLLNLPGDNEIPSGGSSAGYKIALFTLAVVVAPWTEETMIRGFLFSGLDRRFGFWPAAVASGAVWASIHLVWGVLIIFTAEGVVLAWLRARTGSILPGVGIHGVWNTIAAAATGGGWFPLPLLALLLATVILAARRLPPAPVRVTA
ncbi:MAG TPA: type II CAAX endopeptidase family protein [Gaiellales bacterium]